MSPFRGLSGRLLLLTVLVVMLAEVFIFVPSVARFRVDYLEERLRRSEIAALTVLAAPDEMVPSGLQQELLERAGVLNIVLGRGERRALVLSAEHVGAVSSTIDLREATAGDLILDALSCLLGLGRGSVLRVIGPVRGMDAEVIEVALPQAPLREAMIAYGWRILQLSLVISVVTAVVVFLAVRRIVVTPMHRLVRGVRRFQENPEDPGRIITPRARTGEVAEAESAVAAMQREVQRSLAERARLASLGQALGKISHDLRNMLSSGQLMADRLEMSSDPMVVRVLPKLINSLNRAIHLCQRTLDYGRAEEAPPVRRVVSLRSLAEEVTEALGLADGGPVSARIDIAPDHTVTADPEQLYRVLANLVRNAAEAMQASGRPGVVSIAAEPGERDVITIRDTGPGMPAAAIENLFRPFRGGARAGGTGLGLVIARELVQAHGGELTLISSTTEGTAFRITLPSRPPG